MSELIKQTVVLTDKCDLVIDCVQNIVSFDDTFVALQTQGGRINVEGSELRVDSLQKENGKIHIIGNISGVFYSKEGIKQKAFSKLFK